MPEELTRKRRTRAILMIAAGVLGMIGFVREVMRRGAIHDMDVFVLAIASGLFAAGIVSYIRRHA